MYCALFVVLFANLYCTKPTAEEKAQRGLTTPSSIKKIAAGTASLSCGPLYSPALDVGDAAGLFHGHHRQRGDEQEDSSDRVEVQSPKRPKKKRGGRRNNLANVCAVDNVDEDEQTGGGAVRKSTRLKKN